MMLTAPVNLRDLGGIPVAGGRVREGFAIRADDLSTVPESYATGLVAQGVRSVIDLRSAEELTATGRGPLGTQTAVSYHHVPLLASLGHDAEAAAPAGGDPFDQRSYGQMYVSMFERAAPQIVTALAVVAHAPGATAFHCAAGQDRTGVLAAALLLVLGADRQQVVADYLRTAPNAPAIRARLTPTLAPLMLRRGIDLNAAARAATRTEFSAAPMLELLETLGARYSDPLEPLRAGGLTDSLVTALRERAVAGE
ncbi:tyrosine-protein phosphatase [Leucobacter insecticola]|uniref:Tyrosine-protein phosphatase n=1 Tax=Leucobacter insecticola TaxID=2714934 RepID=A0A6G8FIS4_9MICO|nr:tyrosine-protein phosphatase [Leucobacter insecticola]QIM16189.1 tyrosine-protein phosphatase [Leucobacter insecticola]